MLNIKIINLFIRSFTMFSRFLLFFFLAKFLSLKDLGSFGIFLTIISLAVFFSGFELYTYSQRKILSSFENAANDLFHHFFLILIIFLISAPIYLIFFEMSLITYDLILIFYLILFLDLFTQEVMRLLIAFHKQLHASVILFIKLGLMPYIVICLGFLFKSSFNIYYVFYSWLSCLFLSLIFSLFFFKKLNIKIKFFKPDFFWIKNSIKVAIIFLISSSFLKLFFSVDRILLKELSDMTLVGIYVFFTGLVYRTFSLIDSITVMFAYPKLIQSYKNNKTKFVKLKKEFIKTVSIFSIMISFSLFLLSDLIFLWTGKKEFIDFNYIFFIILISGFIYSISNIQHYLLYVYGKDNLILKSSFISFIILIISYYFFGFVTDDPLLHISLAVLFGVISLYSSKAISLFFLKNI